jgi:hypothetical protein
MIDIQTSIRSVSLDAPAASLQVRRHIPFDHCHIGSEKVPPFRYRLSESHNILLLRRIRE